MMTPCCTEAWLFTWSRPVTSHWQLPMPKIPWGWRAAIHPNWSCWILVYRDVMQGSTHLHYQQVDLDQQTQTIVELGNCEGLRACDLPAGYRCWFCGLGWDYVGDTSNNHWYLPNEALSCPTTNCQSWTCWEMLWVLNEIIPTAPIQVDRQFC